MNVRLNLQVTLVMELRKINERKGETDLLKNPCECEVEPPGYTSYGVTQNKGKGKLLPIIEEISGGKAHTNSWKLIRNILTVTDVFLNQNIVNVCEHTIKMASLEFLKGDTRGL